MLIFQSKILINERYNYLGRIPGLKTSFKVKRWVIHYLHQTSLVIYCKIDVVLNESYKTLIYHVTILRRLSCIGRIVACIISLLKSTTGLYNWANPSALCVSLNINEQSHISGWCKCMCKASPCSLIWATNNYFFSASTSPTLISDV